MLANSIQDMCRPVTDRWQSNLVGYFQEYRTSILLVLLAATADMVTTVRFMLASGVEQELHPAIRMAAVALGPILGPVLGKLGQLLAIFIVTVYCRSFARYIFVTVTLIYLWAAWYNVWGKHMYRPLLFDLLAL
jgi:hypothetical protein